MYMILVNYASENNFLYLFVWYDEIIDEAKKQSMDNMA